MGDKACRTLCQTGTSAEPSDASEQMTTDALPAHCLTVSDASDQNRSG